VILSHPTRAGLPLKTDSTPSMAYAGGALAANDTAAALSATPNRLTTAAAGSTKGDDAALPRVSFPRLPPSAARAVVGRWPRGPDSWRARAGVEEVQAADIFGLVRGVVVCVAEIQSLR
jgi:hypothetical protein